VVSLLKAFAGPGPRAPARFLLAASLAPVFWAQAPAAAQVPASAQADVPDSQTAAKLIWSTMAALDQANRTGDYSVFRELGAPSFQTTNSTANLAAIFQSLRAQQIDLGNSLVVIPSYQAGIVPNGLLRIRGSFPLRPFQIGFDLLFQNVSGQWRLVAISVVPLAQPAAGSPGR
jgi:hypothetical protein